MSERQHHLLMVCEMHRYHAFWHKTDSITLHGLDAGDWRAVRDAFGEKINANVKEGPASMAIMDMEHMDVSEMKWANAN